MIETRTINDFLQDLASNSPAPGGGSVAALSGAMGAALVSMVANLTIGNAKYAEHQDLVKDVAQKAEGLVHELIQCADSDMRAFGVVMSALRRPKDAPERTMEIHAAYRGAAFASKQTAEKCLEVMRLAASIVGGRSNRNAECDLYAAGVQASAGIDIAMENLSVNIRLLPDALYKEYKEELYSWAKKFKDERSYLWMIILD